MGDKRLGDGGCRDAFHGYGSYYLGEPIRDDQEEMVPSGFPDQFPKEVNRYELQRGRRWKEGKRFMMPVE